MSTPPISPRPLLLLSLAAFASPWLASVRAQEPEAARDSADPAGRLAMHERHVALAAQSPFEELRWQFLGPTNTSGRVTDVAVETPRGKSYTIYVATASGGVWKTVNEGTSWRPIFEHAPTTSVGAVSLAPSDPKLVWVGTGEANIFRSSMAGTGVYKSLDGGESWTHMGLAATHTIARIAIHPENPDIVYVAASGREWTRNPERGVYRTRDGGESWERVLFVDEQSGAIDLAMDPADPETLYASTWQRTRKRWNDPRNEPGYGGSGIWKSTDGGGSWTSVNTGLPAPEHRGRIGIDIARSNSKVLYAFVDNYSEADEEPSGESDSYGRRRERGIKGAEVYRSDDAGENWRKVSGEDRLLRRLSSTYGWVFGQIRVDPTDPERIYVMGVPLVVSEDGGQSYRRLSGMHGDHHALWIDPDNPAYLVNGNDGGVAISYDGGKRWRTSSSNLPAVQFYNVACDMAEPFHVYGSVQDHGSMRGVVDLTRGRDRIRAREWERAPGGEGCRHAVDPTDPDTVYSAGFYGSIQRSDMRTGERVRLVPEAAEGEPKLRGQWVAPFILSPHNPRIVYHGMNYLYRSLDRGANFERISPDLSHANPEEMGDIPYQTIFSISESPLRFGLIYAGTDDGRAHVTPDSGRSWREITAGLAAQRWMVCIEASRYAEGTVYLAQNGKRWDDFTPYLWRSSDYGLSWRSIVANLPGGPINVIREDPKNSKVLYAGTDLGVYVSVDGGERWEVLGGNLPSTFVHDLVVHPRDDILVIATHGRGMYALDVRPIQGQDEPEEEAQGDKAR